MAGQLHLGDDSDIISVGRTNELWSFSDVDSDQTLYVNYRGYNNGSSRFRSLDIRDGKAGQIVLFNGTDKSTTFAGGLTIPDYINHTGDSGTKFGFSADDTFVVRTGGAVRLTVSDTSATFTGDVILGTGDNLYLNGTTGIRLLHDGSNALFINQTAGDVKIQNSVSDKDIIFIGKDGASTITALTLDMSEGGAATFAGNLTTSATATFNSTHTSIITTGSGTSHTQGAIQLRSGTTDTPEARGQGVFMFNEGKDTTWYMGTRYGNADEWQVGRATGTSVNTEGAQDANAFLQINNAGNATFAGSISVGGHAVNDILVAGDTFANDDSHLMTAAAIEDKILSYGYGTGSGSGSGDVTLAGAQTFTGAKTFNAHTQFSSTVTVGASTSGHDVVFYGNDTGEMLHWDESTSKLNIRHDHEDSGLTIFTVSSAQNTVPQIQIGRDNAQYWGVYTDDRNAHMVHRQDETSGTITTRFDQWDSNTSDTNGEWLWRYGDGSGGSMAIALTLTQAGHATFAGDIKQGNRIVLQDNGTIQWGASANYGNLSWDTGYALIYGQSGNGIKFGTNGSTLALTLDTSQNATFAGHIYLPGSKYIYSNNKGLIGATASQTEIYGISNIISFYAEGGGTKYMTISGGDVAIGTNNPTSLSSNTTSLSIDSTRTDLSGGIFLKANGTVQSQIYWGSSGLNIENLSDDGDIIFKSDNGSGGVENYIQIDGSEGRTLFNKHLRVNDSVELQVGASADLKIYHDGTNTHFANGTGDLNITTATGDMYITNNANDKDIIFQSDNGSGGTTTYLALDGGISSIVVYKDILMANDSNGGKLKFGASQDLQIYHSGTHSYVDGNNTGDLYIRSLNDDVVIQAADDVFIYAQGGEDAIIARGNGAVELYHNNAKKIETVAAGTKTTFAATSSTDGDAAGDIVYFSETSTTAGRIYYYTSAGAWELADADAQSSASGMLAVALGSSSSTHGMLLRGMVTLNHDPGAVGDTLFLSTAIGQATATAPSGAGDIVRVIGYCLHASTGQIWFNPDGAFVEVTAG